MDPRRARIRDDDPGGAEHREPADDASRPFRVFAPAASPPGIDTVTTRSIGAAAPPAAARAAAIMRRGPGLIAGSPNGERQPGAGHGADPGPASTDGALPAAPAHVLTQRPGLTSAGGRHRDPRRAAARRRRAGDQSRTAPHDRRRPRRRRGRRGADRPRRHRVDPRRRALAAKTLTAGSASSAGSRCSAPRDRHPYSCSSWIHSIHRGIDVARAAGAEHIAAATGSTSEAAWRGSTACPSSRSSTWAISRGRRSSISAASGSAPDFGGRFRQAREARRGELDLHSSRSRVDTPGSPMRSPRLARHRQRRGCPCRVGAGEVLESPARRSPPRSHAGSRSRRARLCWRRSPVALQSTLSCSTAPAPSSVMPALAAARRPPDPPPGRHGEAATLARTAIDRFGPDVVLTSSLAGRTARPMAIPAMSASAASAAPTG